MTIYKSKKIFMEIQNCYLVCAFMLFACVAIVALMYYRCERRVDGVKVKNASLQMYVSELGLTVSGLKLLTKNLKKEEVERLLNLIDFHLEKLEKEYCDPDISCNERNYKILRNRWLAIREIFEDELKEF